MNRVQEQLMPRLLRPCECNCAAKAELERLDLARMEVWAAEIEEIESHGFRQGPKGYVPTTGNADELPQIIRAARERSYLRADRFNQAVNQARSKFLPLDEWGAVLQDQNSSLEGYAVRERLKEIERRRLNGL